MMKNNLKTLHFWRINKMAIVTPAMIKELRERTHVAMGKCKQALEEAKGDMDLAIANLRKAGIASAVKKEGRETKEGKIGVAKHGQVVAIVEVNAETDFVVKNERFKHFLHHIAEEIALTNPPSLEAFLQQKYSKDPHLTIDQYRATIVQTIGENIQIRRFLTFKKGADRSLGVYSHSGGKILTVVEIVGSSEEEELAKEIAMHTAAAAPEYLSPEKVPSEVIAHEKEIARAQIQDKPTNVVEKIVEGKINSYYETACLINQKYIKDDSQTITDLVNRRSKEAHRSLSISQFVHWIVGQ
jgi:elongation factor Ts